MSVSQEMRSGRIRKTIGDPHLKGCSYNSERAGERAALHSTALWRLRVPAVAARQRRIHPYCAGWERT